jgi:hypothetical protein
MSEFKEYTIRVTRTFDDGSWGGEKALPIFMVHAYSDREASSLVKEILGRQEDPYSYTMSPDSLVVTKEV